MTDNSSNKFKEYFKNIIRIPGSTSISFVCLNDMIFKKYHTIDDTDRTIYLISDFYADIWKNHLIYRVHYKIMWQIDEIPYPDTDTCYGANCREYMECSMDRWCDNCYGHPDDEMISKIISIMFGESIYNPKYIKFNNICDYVTDIYVLDIMDITQTKPQYIKRSNQYIRIKELYKQNIQRYNLVCMDDTEKEDINKDTDMSEYMTHETKKIRFTV